MKKGLFIITAILLFFACKNSSDAVSGSIVESETKKVVKYPSDGIPFVNRWQILLGDGSRTKTIENYSENDFFYASTENNKDWVVYKTPNSGIASKTSDHKGTELGQIKYWTPETGGELKGTLKVQHVSTSGDARIASSYSVVVGQIHSEEGDENEPLKIFYKKFPGHKKGSIYWNYEINRQGDNAKRWDLSTAVWGYDMSVIGTGSNAYPEEPKDGIELGEEFSYKVNVYQGVMYLTFTSEKHESKTFAKSLIEPDYVRDSNIPQQIQTLYASVGRIDTEQSNVYASEVQYFKQEIYNQTNEKTSGKNIVWNTGSQTYNGDVEKQYENGSYAEVWFKEARLGVGRLPEK